MNEGEGQKTFKRRYFVFDRNPYLFLFFYYIIIYYYYLYVFITLSAQNKSALFSTSFSFLNKSAIFSTLENYNMDSRGETLRHIKRVAHYINIFKKHLTHRAKAHDASKMESPEVEIFDEYTPKLRDTTYDSPEYREFLKEMQVALDHHYTHNSHHPEHYPNGIDDMNLVDIVEMLADWKAATERHADGDIISSIKKNVVRFGISDQLLEILLNTVEILDDTEAT